MKNSNKLVAAAVGAVAVIAIAWLAFGYFGIQSAFVDDEVDEAGPIFDATPAEQDEMAATEEFQDAMAEAEQNRTDVDEDMPPMDDDAGTDEAEPEIVTEASGAFSGTSRYDVTGEAAVLGNGTGQRFLRFEDFESSNGPDLKVYLRADDGSFVSLGELKGNIGSQNYEIPADVDLSTYDSVQIWCERFGVEFGFADLA